MPTNLRLPFDEPPAPRDPLLASDEAARAFAVDPSRNVVLEASAGTGKTRVLVTRYLNLLRAGVDPANILAITFTRKAAAEMRERIVRDLRALSAQSPADAARWRELRGRLGDIGISTIDAFCLALLREFPLEADLEPGFQVADETEVPRFMDEALDAALHAGRRLVKTDEDVALVMCGLGERRLRAGLAGLLGRRLVAGSAIRRFLAAGPAPSPSAALAQASARLAGLLHAGERGVEGFLADGPRDHPAFALVQEDLREVAAPPGASRAAIDRLTPYFLTKDGDPRKRPSPAYRKDDCPSADAWKRHSQVLAQLAPYVADVVAALGRDLNRSMARGVEKLFRIARSRYRWALAAQASLDFTEALARTLGLLRQMDEFSQSRYRLEARYHHVLVDEFQDTSRAQWTLVLRLIESWGEGMGLAHDAPLQPSIFVVGDRKQSIYAFRDADVRMLRRARRHIAALRPGGDVRRSISRSFRAVPALLAFTNDLFGATDKTARRADAFRYGASDRFPVHLATSVPISSCALGVAAAATGAEAAAAVAVEIERILREEQVRDRQTGLTREARPGDVAVLFRSRESHREFEAALEERRIRTYVYKGLGFFDAEEVKDLVALLRFLADPTSNLRAAAFLRSRFVRLSDVALQRLAPSLAGAVTGTGVGRVLPLPSLSEEDERVLRRLRSVLPEWLALVDRLPPAELLDRVLLESAYAFELHGPREAQARENVKKVRALLRRIQNRGYPTLPRIADHLDRLSAGDESNAVIDAVDAVNLMTVHAAKGLEFPIVFLVNLGRGTGGHADPIAVVPDPRGREPLVSVDGGLPAAETATRERDVEETKRLLYVAATRARERLYLSAVVKDGRFRPGRGSLGEVLPDTLRDMLAQAASCPDEGRIEWHAREGSVHAFRVCGTRVSSLAVASTPAAMCATAGAIVKDAPPPADFMPWCDDSAPSWVTVTSLVTEESRGDTPRGETGADAAARRLTGTLVHRLFQALGTAAHLDGEAVQEHARSLVTSEEAAGVEDAEKMIGDAVLAFLALGAQPDFSGLLNGAACLYEVPFSLADEGGAVVRGTIDCLARFADGRIVVVEIKTGRPHEWHQAQLDWYVRAAGALFPGHPVEGRVFYAHPGRTAPDATACRERASN